MARLGGDSNVAADSLVILSSSDEEDEPGKDNDKEKINGEDNEFPGSSVRKEHHGIPADFMCLIRTLRKYLEEKDDRRCNILGLMYRKASTELTSSEKFKSFIKDISNEIERGKNDRTHVLLLLTATCQTLAVGEIMWSPANPDRTKAKHSSKTTMEPETRKQCNAVKALLFNDLPPAVPKDRTENKAGGSSEAANGKDKVEKKSVKGARQSFGNHNDKSKNKHPSKESTTVSTENTKSSEKGEKKGGKGGKRNTNSKNGDNQIDLVSLSPEHVPDPFITDLSSEASSILPVGMPSPEEIIENEDLSPTETSNVIVLGDFDIDLIDNTEEEDNTALEKVTVSSPKSESEKSTCSTPVVDSDEKDNKDVNTDKMMSLSRGFRQYLKSSSKKAVDEGKDIKSPEIEKLSLPLKEKEKTSSTKKTKKSDNSSKKTKDEDEDTPSKSSKVKESPLSSPILSPCSRRSTFLKAIEKVKEDGKADRRALTVEIYAPPEKPKEKKTTGNAKDKSAAAAGEKTKGTGKKKKGRAAKGSRTPSEDSSDDEVLFVSETPAVMSSVPTTHINHTALPGPPALAPVPAPNQVHNRMIPCPDLPWNDMTKDSPGANLLDMCYVYEITPSGDKVPSSLVCNKKVQQPSILSSRDTPTEFTLGRDGRVIEPTPGVKQMEKRKYTSENHNPGPVKSVSNTVQKSPDACTHQRAQKTTKTPCRNIVIPGRNNIVIPGRSIVKCNSPRIKSTMGLPIQSAQKVKDKQVGSLSGKYTSPNAGNIGNKDKPQVQGNKNKKPKKPKPKTPADITVILDTSSEESGNEDTSQDTTQKSSGDKGNASNTVDENTVIMESPAASSGEEFVPDENNSRARKENSMAAAEIEEDISEELPAAVSSNEIEDAPCESSGDELTVIETPTASLADDGHYNKENSMAAAEIEEDIPEELPAVVSNDEKEDAPSESSGDELTVLETSTPSSADNGHSNKERSATHEEVSHESISEKSPVASDEDAEIASGSSGDEVTVVPSTSPDEDMDEKSPMNDEEEIIPNTDEADANPKSPSESSGDEVTLISDSDPEKEEKEKKEGEERETDEGNAVMPNDTCKDTEDALEKEETVDRDVALPSEETEDATSDNEDTDEERIEDVSEATSSADALVSDPVVKLDAIKPDDNTTKPKKKKSISFIANTLKKKVEEEEEDEIKIIDSPNNPVTASIFTDVQRETMESFHSATPNVSSTESFHSAIPNVSSIESPSVRRAKSCLHSKLLKIMENTSNDVILIGDDSDDDEPEKMSASGSCESSVVTDKPSSSCKKLPTAKQCNKETTVCSKPLTTKKQSKTNSKPSLVSNKTSMSNKPSLSTSKPSATGIKPSLCTKPSAKIESDKSNTSGINKSKSTNKPSVKNSKPSLVSSKTSVSNKPSLPSTKPSAVSNETGKGSTSKSTSDKQTVPTSILSKPSKPSPGSNQVVKNKLSTTKTTSDTTTYVSKVLSNNSSNTDSTRIQNKTPHKSDKPSDTKKSTSNNENSVPQSPPGNKIINLSSKESKIRHLECILERLERKINRYARQELSFKEMSSEESAYMQEARAKERYLYNWRLYCKLTGEDADSVVSSRKKIKVTSSPFPHLNSAVERYINKSDIFPNLFEVKQVCTQTNIKYNLDLKDKELHHCAVDIFSEVGRKLQKRREKEFRTNAGNVLTDQVKPEEDPARIDADLKLKLKQNKKIARQKTDHVFKDFVRQQYEQVTGDVESNDSNDSDRESELREKVRHSNNRESNSDNEDGKSESDVLEKGDDSGVQEKDSDSDTQEKDDPDSQEKDSDSDSDSDSQEKDTDSDSQEKDSDSDEEDKNSDVDAEDKDSDSDTHVSDDDTDTIRKKKRRLSEKNPGKQLVKKKRVDKTVISLTLSSSQEIAEQSGNKKIDYQLTIGSSSPKVKTQNKNNDSRTKSPVSTQVTQKQQTQRLSLLQSKSKHFKSKPTLKKQLPTDISTETPDSARSKDKSKSAGDSVKTSETLNTGKRKRISMMDKNDSRVLSTNIESSKSVGTDSKKQKSDGNSFDKPFPIKKKVRPSLISEKHVLGTGEKNDSVPAQYSPLSYNRKLSDVTTKKKDNASANKENSKSKQQGETIILDDD